MQVVVIALLHCSLEEQQNEVTALVGAVFSEACKDNNRNNLASEKVVVVRLSFFFQNLESLVILEGGRFSATSKTR